MEKFNYLYFFDSDAAAVVESKRLDLTTSASLSDVYKWTVFEKREKRFTSLTFRSMTKRETEEQRSFKEGELSFNSTAGDLKFQGQAFTLKSLKPETIPKDLRLGLEAYLLNLPQHH